MIRTLAVLALVRAAGGFVARPRPRAATARRASDADLLAAAAGVGRGMAAKRKNKHVNKYQKKDVKEDPWERAMRRAEAREDEAAPAPPTYALQADCFCEGAALAREGGAPAHSRRQGGGGAVVPHAGLRSARISRRPVRTAARRRDAAQGAPGRGLCVGRQALSLPRHAWRPVADEMWSSENGQRRDSSIQLWLRFLSAR